MNVRHASIMIALILALTACGNEPAIPSGSSIEQSFESNGTEEGMKETNDSTENLPRATKRFEPVDEIINAELYDGYVQIDDILLKDDMSMTFKDVYELLSNGENAQHYNFFTSENEPIDLNYTLDARRDADHPDNIDYVDIVLTKDNELFALIKVYNTSNVEMSLADSLVSCIYTTQDCIDTQNIILAHGIRCNGEGIDPSTFLSDFFKYIPTDKEKSPSYFCDITSETPLICEITYPMIGAYIYFHETLSKYEPFYNMKTLKLDFSDEDNIKCISRWAGNSSMTSGRINSAYYLYKYPEIVSVPYYETEVAYVPHIRSEEDQETIYIPDLLSEQISSDQKNSSESDNNSSGWGDEEVTEYVDEEYGIHFYLPSDLTVTVKGPLYNWGIVNRSYYVTGRGMTDEYLCQTEKCSDAVHNDSDPPEDELHGEIAHQDGYHYSINFINPETQYDFQLSPSMIKFMNSYRQKILSTAWIE